MENVVAALRPGVVVFVAFERRRSELCVTGGSEAELWISGGAAVMANEDG